MATAQIRIDQPGNPTETGTPGRARDDILAGAAVLLRNVDDNGVIRHFWDLLDKPVGSAAVLSNPTSAVATLTPDQPGTYRVYLRVNNGRNRRGEEDFTDIIVRDAAGFRDPAYNEGLDSDFAIGGGLFNEVGPLHEYRRRMRSLDNRGSQYAVPGLAGGGTDHDFELDFGLPDAQLVWLEIRSTASTNAQLQIFGNAARSFRCFNTGGFNATLTPYFSNVATLISRTSAAGLEDRKIYLRLTNNDVLSDFTIGWRFQAL